MWVLNNAIRHIISTALQLYVMKPGFCCITVMIRL
jgi:hypothetical protein